MNQFRVALLGSGSGGHYMPMVAVADKLKEQAAGKGIELRMRYFGDPGSYAEYIQSHGIVISRIASSKMRRYASVLNFLDFFKFFFGFVQALFKLYFFMPEVVFSKSGPGVLPIVYAARWYRIPVIIHESDSVPGITNRISAKHAAIVELAFEGARAYFGAHKNVKVVGLPVRDAAIGKQSPSQGRALFGLPDEKPVLMVIGGSQGAQALNEFVIGNAETLLMHFEVIHQVGQENFEQFAKEFAFVTKYLPDQLKNRYRSLAFFDEAHLAAAFAAADIVLSRAGSSIFEIAANGKPAILVPLPAAANNHQAENAYAYARAGAALVVEEPNLLPGLVLNQIEKVLDSDERKVAMAKAATAFYRPSAALDIAQDILSFAHN